MSNEKNCMNCMHRMPKCDGEGKNGCRLNPDMAVNRRMTCEEWRSDDTTTMTQPPVYAVSTTSLTTEKIRRH